MQGDAKPDRDPKASAKLFHAFAAAGQKLADLHVDYESAKEFPLKRHENKAVKLDWRVENMKLIGRANLPVGQAAQQHRPTASIVYNDFLTLSGTRPKCSITNSANRSALEWVIDQYRVKRDAQGNITSDPNRLDDEQYIVRFIGQVITVSLETMKGVRGFPEVKFSGLETEMNDNVLDMNLSAQFSTGLRER